MNLIAPAEVAALGEFDAILCCNVLVYFNDARTLEVLDALSARLVGDGVLLVGVSACSSSTIPPCVPMSRRSSS